MLCAVAVCALLRLSCVWYLLFVSDAVFVSVVCCSVVVYTLCSLFSCSVLSFVCFCVHRVCLCFVLLPVLLMCLVFCLRVCLLRLVCVVVS